jgi:hypothetical protein
VIKTVDIGGGSTHGAGRNTIRGNGYYDVQIATDQNFTSLFSDTVLISGNSFMQKNLVDKVTYFWRVKGINLAGGGNWSETRKFSILVTGVESMQAGGMTRFQNYPNPFSGETTLVYSLSHPGNVRITLYDSS